MRFSQFGSSSAVLVAGGFVAAFMLGGWLNAPTQAQPPAPVAGPSIERFQISSFASDGTSCGAYILDTQTGDVFQVVGKQPPTFIGSAVRPPSKKQEGP
jgi:hypothetical protein